MVRYFFHTLDGQRTIDHEGTLFESLEEAKEEAVRRACLWVNGDPSMLTVHQDCRLEVTRKDAVTLFSIIMFAVDHKVWAGQPSGLMFGHG